MNNTISLLMSAIISLSLANSLLSFNFNFLVIVPKFDGTTAPYIPKQSWQNTEELLSVARQSVNQLHLPFGLSMTELRMDCSSPALSLVQLVRELTAADTNKTTVAVIGLFCKGISTPLNGIVDQKHLGLIQIALNTFMSVVDEQRSCTVLSNASLHPSLC